MTTTDTFKCSVISPERVILECDASFIAMPAHDGEIGILRDRAPLMCKLGIGVLRITSETQGGSLFIDGGFAQVLDNKVTILTEQAKRPDEIDAAATREALAAAKDLKITDEAAGVARSRAIKRARVQLKLARP